MANRSVQLYLYADLPGIGWRYSRAAFGANDKPKPHVLIRPDGAEEHHPEADYYLVQCRCQVTTFKGKMFMKADQ